MAASTGDKVSFSKYHGLGNDFVLVDNRSSSEPCVTPEQAVKICDRNFGVGGDGVIFALPPTEGDAIDYTMRIYNSDGSEPEMCGNGIRCLARFVADLDGKPPGSYRVNTLAGLMIPEVRADGQVAVDMGEPFLVPSDVPTTLGANSPEGAAVKVPLEVAGEEWLMTCVGMGNPHAITFGTTSNSDLKVDELPLETLGPLFECNEVFPAKTNTEFVEIIDRGRVKMRVWERGAGLTLACGTGACATVVAGVLEGRLDRECVVELPGGPLEILWRESDNHIIMTGPAEGVFAGDLSL
eukprot:CAMPEP_0197847610 /NCGR_PEP_ID=MMETSP1438-20131217/6586_1 /TAXON_ID=1461541 /ORGANISM="Pterosperma sp., Strain CCMP1384" /LENGTH=295 /DNA_ID=CAMNT_0043459581 /DNA_START=273 /DNA_END=1160 /DNA_ORIENTATION=-